MLHVEVELDMTGGTGSPPAAGGHRIIDLVETGTTKTCTGGTASFAVTLQDSTAGADVTTGWNHFMVRQGDPDDGPTTVSNRFSVRYDA